ncbi:MAG: hypothetical protein VB137_12065 [Burkholderia sp.]
MSPLWSVYELARYCTANVAQVVRDVGLQDPKALRKALYEAYPFGIRASWPYKVWLAEIKEQIGGMRPAKPDPRQGQLF